jgi:hypothetical protein
MGGVDHCSNVRYAIIQASSMKDHPEKLVIAYRNENCLRDLIAVPSIAGLGFRSREAAIANLAGSTTDPSSFGAKASRQSHISRGSTETDVAGTADLEKDRRMSFRILQCALSMAIVVFYSENLVSAMIRITLGLPS